jgi:translation initiation factor 4E
MVATAGSNVHRLQTPFIFSYMRRGKAAKSDAVAGTTTTTEDAPYPYENAIKTITQVETVEEFWETYDFLKRPNDLPATTDYHFFRGGETPIKPTWEDVRTRTRVGISGGSCLFVPFTKQCLPSYVLKPSNAKGGKWIIRMPKGLASRYWEEIILALIGGQFAGVPDGHICGAVLSVRYVEDILGVWNRDATDREIIDRIRDAIKKILQLPPSANMEYKPHQASLQDRSSFRNTQVWKPSKERTSATMPESTGGVSSRRSGSWTERDKSVTTSNKPSMPRGGGDRGSWRTASHG